MEYIILVVYLAILIAMIAGGWKTFVKAGAPGWACLVPILNIYVVIKLIGKPIWWIVLFFIPIVGIIAAIIVMIEFAKGFGKGIGTAIGLVLLGFIFWPMLGFGSAEWEGEEFSW